MFIHEYCTGVSAGDGEEQKCLHIAMLYRPDNHRRSSPRAELTPMQRNILPPTYASLPPSPPAYETLPPPSYESLPPSPPAYETLPPPAYETLPPPPPPYERQPASPPSYDSLFPARPRSVPCNASSSRLTTTLPPLSTFLSSMGSAPSSYPPPYTRLPSSPTTAVTPRFSVFHVRYYGSVADKQDSSRDRHKLFVLTSPGGARARGIYLHVSGRRRRDLRFKETPGKLPEATRGLRESTLLGSVSAKHLDELSNICRQVHLDKLAGLTTKGSALRGTALSKERHYVLYTVDMPPPPYLDSNLMEPLALASRSQEWVATVIAMAQSGGILQRN